MADFSQNELNEELRSRQFTATDFRTPGGHRLWLARNNRFVYVPDWGGPYKTSLLDEIVRVAPHPPGREKQVNPPTLPALTPREGL